ncbi:hypothetical protein AYY17_01970 [Morganella psychrotolerans]|uniref:Uncharacterized protein n=1 Tax=Morganella psychrotolerans TaxID=368603 RepID=A0A1B8HQ13_9GAMM|nr:hypothetical protein AYY17_01970 [Morganella psychrotolerans]
MQLTHLDIRNNIETLTAEIRESVTLLEIIYSECDDEKLSDIVSCAIRATRSTLLKADDLVRKIPTKIAGTSALTISVSSPQSGEV